MLLWLYGRNVWLSLGLLNLKCQLSFPDVLAISSFFTDFYNSLLCLNRLNSILCLINRNFWQEILLLNALRVFIVNFFYYHSMPFNRSSVVMQPDWVPAWIRAIVEAKLFSDYASWIKGNEKLISKFAHNSIFHRFVDIVRDIIVFFIDS